MTRDLLGMFVAFLWWLARPRAIEAEAIAITREHLNTPRDPWSFLE